VPDTRTNRGAHPKDGEDFAAAALPPLRAAAGDLCWLLSRGYAKGASATLVGDRHGLTARQRTALQRVAASNQDCAARRAKEVPPQALAGEELLVDGYNVLLTVETALGGGVVLLARDGAVRDMASMSGHYRRVRQTLPALERLGAFLSRQGPRRVLWYLDRPISNSGRLKKLIEEAAQAAGWPWEVELAANPDRLLIASAAIVASADSAVLDRCRRWVNLARHVVEEMVPEAWVVDLA
jgi:hypothetical protein